MAHWDRVAPGLVRRVIYETLIDDVEGALRRLADRARIALRAGDARYFHRNRQHRADDQRAAGHQLLHARWLVDEVARVRAVARAACRRAWLRARRSERPARKASMIYFEDLEVGKETVFGSL